MLALPYLGDKEFNNTKTGGIRESVSPNWQATQAQNAAYQAAAEQKAAQAAASRKLGLGSAIDAVKSGGQAASEGVKRAMQSPVVQKAIRGGGHLVGAAGAAYRANEAARAASEGEYLNAAAQGLWAGAHALPITRPVAQAGELLNAGVNAISGLWQPNVPNRVDISLDAVNAERAKRGAAPMTALPGQTPSTPTTSPQTAEASVSPTQSPQLTGAETDRPVVGAVQKRGLSYGQPMLSNTDNDASIQGYSDRDAVDDAKFGSYAKQQARIKQVQDQAYADMDAMNRRAEDARAAQAGYGSAAEQKAVYERRNREAALEKELGGTLWARQNPVSYAKMKAGLMAGYDADVTKNNEVKATAGFRQAQLDSASADRRFAAEQAADARKYDADARKEVGLATAKTRLAELIRDVNKDKRADVRKNYDDFEQYTVNDKGEQVVDKRATKLAKDIARRQGAERPEGVPEAVAGLTSWAEKTMPGTRRGVDSAVVVKPNSLRKASLGDAFGSSGVDLPDWWNGADVVDAETTDSSWFGNPGAISLRKVQKETGLDTGRALDYLYQEQQRRGAK